MCAGPVFNLDTSGPGPGASDPGLRQLRTARPGRAAHVLGSFQRGPGPGGSAAPSGPLRALLGPLIEAAAGTGCGLRRGSAAAWPVILAGCPLWARLALAGFFAL